LIIRIRKCLHGIIISMIRKKNRDIFLSTFPVPRFLQMQAVGFDISDQRIRFLEFKKTKDDHLEVKRYDEEDIPPGVVVSGRIKRDKELNEIIKSFGAKHNIEFAHVSLPEELVYLVKMEIPKVEPGEIRDSILFQLEEYVPIPAGETVFDYYIIGKSKKHKDKIDVLVSVLPSREVEKYTNMFQETGITPISFEIEAEAIAHAVIEKGDNETYIVVDFGKTRTGIFIVSEGTVFFTSTIEVGSDMVTRTLAKTLGISYEEADIMKNKKGITRDKKNQEFFWAVGSVVSVLRDELNKLYLYWHTHKQEEDFRTRKIKEIILCGGGANLNGLSEYLSGSMRVDVSVANPWGNVNSFDEYIPDIPFNKALGYSAVIGLSLRTVDNK